MIVTSTEQEIIRVAPRPAPITSRSTITVGGSGILWIILWKSSKECWIFSAISSLGPKWPLKDLPAEICLKNMFFAMMGCCKFCTNWNAASSTKTVVGYVSRDMFMNMRWEIRMRTYKWRRGWSCGSLSAELRSEKISWKEKLNPRTAWRDKFMPGWNTVILEILFPFILSLLIAWRSFPPINSDNNWRKN